MISTTSSISIHVFTNVVERKWILFLQEKSAGESGWSELSHDDFMTWRHFLHHWSLGGFSAQRSSNAQLCGFLCYQHIGAEKNGCHFPYDIFKSIFMNENCCILREISLKFNPQGPINQNKLWTNSRNSLCSNKAIWWHRSGSTMAQVLPSCLTWTNVDLSSKVLSSIHPRVIYKEYSWT